MAWQGGFKGDSYDRAGWRAYLRTQKKPMMASFLAIHATGAPYTVASIGGAKRMSSGLLNYYKNEKKWKGGPNAFAMGDGRIYVGTPLALMGVHSPSFNNISTAFEAEGDYRKGKRDWLLDPGGKAVWDCMAWAAAEWLEWMGYPADDKHVRFHMEDTRTTHRECPGAMKKVWFLGKVRDAMNPLPASPPPAPPPVVMPIVTAKPKPKVYMPGQFQYSDWLIPAMQRVEGLRLKAYPDAPGWAIGYGHNSTSKLAPIPYEGMTCTVEEAVEMLKVDLKEGLRYLNTWVKVPLEEGMVDALLMFQYQQGPTQFRRKLVPSINQKLHWTVAKMIERMPHAKPGVERRRKFEALRYRGDKPTKW